jgi:hypothetical protein
MPNIYSNQTMYIDTGDADTFNETTLYKPGELGQVFQKNDRGYQLVKLDSGAVASILTPAANQLLYWKDRTNYIVTNDYRFGLYGGVANSHANNVAGVLRCAATPGNYIWVLQRGRNIAVEEEGSATAGMRLHASVTTPVADTIGVAVGTQLTYNQLGVVRTATATTTAYADLDIPPIP